MHQINKSGWLEGFFFKGWGENFVSVLFGSALYHLEMLLIATYSKPNNDGLLFYCITRSPMGVGFVVMTSLRYSKDIAYFYLFCLPFSVCLPFHFSLIASCGASHFCLFQSGKEKLFTLCHEPELSHVVTPSSKGGWENECLSKKKSIVMTDLDQPWFISKSWAVCYHKQKWGFVSKKGRELLDKQLTAPYHDRPNGL